MGRSPASEPDVRLREVEDADLELFFEHQRDPRGLAMAAVPGREREAFFRHWERVRADPAALAWTILADGEVAGNIGSWEAGGEREVGYWIAPTLWGRGIATGAVKALLGIVPVRPLHAHVAAHNLASLRVLEKCGFRRTGSHRAEDGVELVSLILDR